MSDTPLGFPEAARRLGVSIRILRQAIRAGSVPAPPQVNASATVPAAWLAEVSEKAKSAPAIFARSFRQKVPAFARYEGTSAWHKHRSRVRANAWHGAAAKRKAAAQA